ncbi:unnamed protein product [Prunus brigantina]
MNRSSPLEIASLFLFPLSLQVSSALHSHKQEGPAVLEIRPYGCRRFGIEDTAGYVWMESMKNP